MLHHLLQKSGEKNDEFSDEFITLKSARENTLEKNINNQDEVNDVCFHSLSLFRSLFVCDFIGNIHKERERERETCLSNNSPLNNNNNNDEMMISKTMMRIEQQLEENTLEKNSGNFWNSSLSAPALKSAARV